MISVVRNNSRRHTFQLHGILYQLLLRSCGMYIILWHHRSYHGGLIKKSYSHLTPMLHHKENFITHYTLYLHFSSLIHICQQFYCFWFVWYRKEFYHPTVLISALCNYLLLVEVFIITHGYNSWIPVVNVSFDYGTNWVKSVFQLGNKRLFFLNL